MEERRLEADHAISIGMPAGEVIIISLIDSAKIQQENRISKLLAQNFAEKCVIFSDNRKFNYRSRLSEK